MKAVTASFEDRVAIQSDVERVTGSGVMADMVRAKDWSDTSLGPRETWSDTLVSLVNLVLSTPFPSVLFWGPELVTIYNDHYCAFLATRHPTALGRSGREVWSEAWSIIGPQFEAVLRDGKPVVNHKILVPILEDGAFHDRYWNYSITPVFQDGKIAGLVNVGQDITPEVQAARERDEANARLTQILSDTNDGIVTIAPDWRVTYMNPRALAVSSPINPVGKNLWESYPAFVYPGSPWIENYYRAMNERQPCTFEAFYPEPLNVWVAVHVQPSKEGITLFFGEITERKRIAEALAESQQAAVRSEAQLKLITDALPALISYLDPDLRYVRVNRTYEEWFERPASDFVGRTIEEVLGEPGATAVRGPMQKALAGQTQRFEYTLPIRSGERILQVTHIPDVDEHGHIRGVIVQGDDITDRKRSEKALMQTEKLAAAGRLAASIAHEINNPLEAMTNLLYLARSSSTREEVNGYLDTADLELRRVSSIASQTLRFYKQTTRPTEVCGSDLFDNLVAVYQGRLLNSKVQVQRRDRRARTVQCFEGEIRQVLINLIGNSIDALHGVGGKLLLRSQEGRNWKTGELGVVLTVADTAGGMPLEIQIRIFEAFYSTKGIGGTGLGLWVSKEIVDRHLGRLTMRSSEKLPCSGTVFRLFLPFKSALR